MRIAQFSIGVAATAALCGIGLGIFMAIHHDFTLMPAHAHLNLLGWVSMALYGLYYRGVAVLRPRLAWTQAIAGTLGFIAMSSGLAAMLATGNGDFEAVISVGALLSALGMALFLFQVLTENRRPASVARAAAARG